MSHSRDAVERVLTSWACVIRLFIQEYFNLLPERGRYHFDTLDRSVNASHSSI